MTSIVEFRLPDDLKSMIAKQVANGRADSDADFLVDAARW
jgi:Arc/MetJ-type ribon-helix-helix transcriptional regulator